MTEAEVNSETLYWVRLNFTTADPLILDGLNLILSDDAQLEKHFSNVLDPRIVPSGQTSHIDSHVSARDSIIQRLRVEGYIKYDSENNEENVNVWDLLDIYEFREAATYWALARIFFNLSDSVEDLWWAKHDTYTKQYEKAYNRARLTVDIDDDGVVDSAENKRVARTSRVVR